MSQQFFIKLIPHHPTFAQDMSVDERKIMQQHIVYWTDLMHKRIAVVFGPVLDPAGQYGIGIIEASDEAQLHGFLDRDPAKVLMRYEWWPMRAVHPEQTRSA